MIPYIDIPEIPVFGELTLKPFGILVAIGVLVGQWYVRRRAKALGVNDDRIFQALVWTLVGGFVMAHLVAVFFYFPHRLVEQGPILLLKVWKYLSSMGGFLGALIGLLLWFKVKKENRRLFYMDIIVQGLVPGWVFGRLACAITHDHPGRLTDFFLGVKYPDGVRHDLGFYEFLFTLLILLPLVLGLRRFKLPDGAYLAIVSIVYAPVRFPLDFLRTEGGDHPDRRYLGLTAAQYFCIILLITGITLAVRIWHKQAEEPIQDAAAGKTNRKEKRKRKKKKKN